MSIFNFFYFYYYTGVRRPRKEKLSARRPIDWCYPSRRKPWQRRSIRWRQEPPLLLPSGRHRLCNTTIRHLQHPLRSTAAATTTTTTTGSNNRICAAVPPPLHSTPCKVCNRGRNLRHRILATDPHLDIITITIDFWSKPIHISFKSPLDPFFLLSKSNFGAQKN